jgi:hypothetical protein
MGGGLLITRSSPPIPSFLVAARLPPGPSISPFLSSPHSLLVQLSASSLLLLFGPAFIPLNLPTSAPVPLLLCAPRRARPDTSLSALNCISTSPPFSLHLVSAPKFAPAAPDTCSFRAQQQSALQPSPGHHHPRPLLIAPTTSPVGRFSIHTLPIPRSVRSLIS